MEEKDESIILECSIEFEGRRHNVHLDTAWCMPALSLAEFNAEAVRQGIADLKDVDPLQLSAFDPQPLSLNGDLVYEPSTLIPIMKSLQAQVARMRGIMPRSEAFKNELDSKEAVVGQPRASVLDTTFISVLCMCAGHVEGGDRLRHPQRGRRLQRNLARIRGGGRCL